MKLADRIAALEARRRPPADKGLESFKRLVERVAKTAAATCFYDLAYADLSQLVPVDRALSLIRAEVPGLWGSPEADVREVVDVMLRMHRAC